jgi:hypothetical protein
MGFNIASRKLTVGAADAAPWRCRRGLEAPSLCYHLVQIQSMVAVSQETQVCGAQWPRTYLINLTHHEFQGLAAFWR